jgi:hypothetical protein
VGVRRRSSPTSPFFLPCLAGRQRPFVLHGLFRGMAPEPARRDEEVDQALELVPVGRAQLLQVRPGLSLVPQGQPDLDERAPGHLGGLFDQPRLRRCDLRHVKAARDVHDGAAPAPVQEIRLAALGPLHTGRGQRGGVGHHAERRDPRLAGVLGPEERQHGIRHVALEEVRGPHLPFAHCAVQHLRVAAGRIERDDAHGGDPLTQGVVEGQQARLPAAVRTVEGGEVRDPQSDRHHPGQRLEQREHPDQRAVRRPEHRGHE